MTRLIEANAEIRKNICDHFNVTNSNVSQALKFQRNSKKAIAIRKMAIENGATLFEKTSNTIQNENTN